MKPNHDDIFFRLVKIYKEFSGARKVDSYSQMCEFWEDPTVEVLVDSDELNALEIEFGIEFDDDSAMELYDMSLKEATILITNMLYKQNPNFKFHYSKMIIDKLSPEDAKLILLELWRNNHKIRKDILSIIEKKDF